MKKLVFGLLALLLLCADPAPAQTYRTNVSKKGTTAGSFLSISQGARAASMGSAFVAVANDWSAMYWNPAGIASLNNGVVFDHTIWFADLGYNYIAGGLNLGSLGSLGMSLTSSSVGDMPVTTVDAPEGTGEVFNVSQVAFSIGYGINLTDNFAIGFNPKFVYERIWKMSASAFAIDVGVKYVTPFSGVVLGMNISNFGEKMHMTGENAVVLYDANTSSSGNNGRIASELQTSQWALPLNFQFGLAYTPKLGDMHKFTIAVDALHPSDDYESLNVGGEYTFDDFISFRGGYKALFLKESEESFTLGVGFKQALLGNIALLADYSYINFGRLKAVHKITVGMTF